MMSSHDPLNTQENRLPSESNKPRLAENRDSRRDESSSQSTGDAVVTDRRYERGLEAYASQFQIPREEVASWLANVFGEPRSDLFARNLELARVGFQSSFVTSIGHHRIACGLRGTLIPA